MIGVLALASRIGVINTVPELERDIDAQLRALADPDHPKRAVFLARGNSLGNRELPKWLFVHRRPEGTLVTDCAALADTFRELEFVTDEDLAALLGYPECKADILLGDEGCIVQALDAEGCVIFEAACSRRKIDATIAAADAQVPAGGRRVVTTPAEAIARRVPRMH